MALTRTPEIILQRHLDQPFGPSYYGI
nr:unnamed protein product [Callosobruchus analis]